MERLYVFSKTNGGLHAECPISDPAATATLYRELDEFNRLSGGDRREAVVAPKWPPPGMKVQPGLGLVPATLAEQVAAGDLTLPPDQKVIGNTVQRKTDAELIAAGLLSLDPSKEKLIDGRKVPESRQELLESGQLSPAQVREEEVNRLRGEVEAYFSTTRTASGLRLDYLARQKAAFSMQYRHLPDSDAVKSDLLGRKVIYPDAMVDEILTQVETAQAAYSRAKAVLETAVADGRPLTELETIHVAGYLEVPV